MITHDCEVKIIDFTLMKRDEEFSGSVLGTPYYIAPEIIKQMNSCGKYSLEKVDVWSLGVLLHQMTTHQELPWGSKTDWKEILFLQEMCPATLQLNHISESLQDLLVNMLSPSVENRMILEEVCEHDWLQFNFSEINFDASSSSTISYHSENLSSASLSQNMLPSFQMIPSRPSSPLVVESQATSVNFVDSVVEIMRRELEKANQKISELENSLKESQEKSFACEEALFSAKEELAMTKKELSDAKQGLYQAKEELLNAREEIGKSNAGANSACESLSKKLEQMEQSKESALQEMRNNCLRQVDLISQNCSTELEMVKQAQQREVEKLQSLYLESLKNNQKLQRKVDTLLQSLSVNATIASEKEDLLKSRCESLQHSLSNLQVVNDQLYRDLETLGNRLNDKCAQLASKDEEWESMNLKLAQMKQQYSPFTQNCSEYPQQCFPQPCGAQSCDLSFLEEKIKFLEEENSALRKKHQLANTKWNAVREKCTSLKADIEKKNSEYADLLFICTQLQKNRKIFN